MRSGVFHEPSRLVRALMPRLSRVSLMVVGALSISTGKLDAQTEPRIGELTLFTDSISTVTDTAALHALQRQLEHQADGARESALLSCKAGIAALRLGTMGNRWRLHDAEHDFARAEKLRPGWAYPPYGIGLVKAAESARQRSDPREMGVRVGMGALSDAVDAFARAVRRDPSFEPAVVALGRTAFSGPDLKLWQQALDGLRRAVWAADARGPSEPPPPVLLWRGRLERAAGNADSALQAFGRNLAGGGSPGLGLLELARTRLALGRPGGDTAYYAGAIYDDSASVVGYRDDLALITSDTVLASFDSTAGAGRVAFLRRFWTERAQLELRTPAERLAEHYRRIRYARQKFTPETTRRPHWMYDLTPPDNPEFDDRGLVYIRYGEPAIRLRPIILGALPNESWRYNRPDGDLMVHFGGLHAVDDYRLTRSAYEATGIKSWDVLASRAPLDELYSNWLGWGPFGQARMARREHDVSVASAAIILRSDAYDLHFAHKLPAALSLVAVGRAPGSSDDRSLVHIVFAIPGEATHGDTTTAGTLYPVRVRFVAFDSTEHVVAAMDSSFVLVTPIPADSGRFLFGRVALPVPPGDWQYRLALQQGDSSGVVLPTDSLVVGNFAGDHLGVSDLVVGWRRIPLTWQRPGADTVYFSPFRSYFEDSELELYYEVYGLAPGSSYGAELTVTEVKSGLFHGRPRTVDLGFRGQADAAGHGAGRHTLQLSELRPGRYRLELVVSNGRGEMVERAAEIRIQGRR